MIRILGRLRTDRRGGAAILIAAALPVLIGAGALAVDLGSIQLETRRLQGIADAAALAAASDSGNAQAAAQSTVAASGWPRATTVVAAPGAYRADPTIAIAQRFVAGAPGADAARVTIESQSPTFLARIFGTRSVTISRTATAARQRTAAFSIGSRLASLDGGILNAYLSALTGSNVSLSLLDYNALAGADVDLFNYLPLLRTQAAARALTFDEVLNARVTAPQALSALAAALAADNQGGGAAAVRTIAATIPGGQTIALSALIDAGPIGKQSSGGTGLVRTNVLAMVTAILQLASPSRQVQLDMGATIPGLASTRVSLAVGDRMQQSPWIAITDGGAPVVRTAQARLYVDGRIAPTLLPGLANLASVRIPLFVEVAAAEGRVAAIDCPTVAGRGVTIDARTNPGKASLGDIDTSLLQDFSKPVAVSAAALVDTLLVDVTGSANADLGAAEPWQPVRFDQAAIDAGTLRTVKSTTPVQGIAASLLDHPSLQARVIGLPIPLDPLLRSVGGLLSGAAPALDRLILLTTGTLGIGVGEADVRVTGMRCGQAVLVS